MKKICFIFLYIFCGCVDYTNIHKLDELNFAPKIVFDHLSPHPLNVSMPISVGENCKGQTFKVPPIIDKNLDDKLYYLWFFDQELVSLQSVIEPHSRDKAIIVFTLDRQFLFSHFGAKLPEDFFLRRHTLELVVADKRYEIPESRLMEGYVQNEENHQDNVFWVIQFNNDSCQ